MTAAMRGFYVTGTDTGVGKTVVSVALLHALRARGLAAVGMKPVASGCEQTPEGLRNEDALALQAASRPSHPYDTHNPYALPEATAPELAARRAGVQVALGPIRSAYSRLGRGADIRVVEGVGGWMAPLAEGLEQSALTRALRLPVLLVVGIRLGCLSHARLSERAIRADRRPLLGWIGNVVDGAFADASEYRALLERDLQSPCLGWLPYDPAGTPEQRAQGLERASAWQRLPAGGERPKRPIY
jgi:dethiobiotin synthetase